MRLDRVLSNSGYGSRSEVRQMVRSGRVSVAGITARDPGQILSQQEMAAILLDSETLVIRLHRHVMLNKPAGLITAMEDPHLPTIADLIPAAWKSSGVTPVGRLDRDATGLLLLTNDGTLNHRLASPRWGVWKTYRLTYSGTPLGDTERGLFAAGLILPDGQHCRSAILTLLQDNMADLAIHEGKFHQVKNMIQGVGRKVITLHRMTFGPLKLDETLNPGSSRELTQAEADALYKVVQLEQT
ncbi:MAG: pseudouridine synthase [Bacillota bacterium]|nr:pseudouridine synthase [Bacillota bacterium]